MLLFTKRFQDAIVRGEVTVTFRRWERPHVRVGGRYRCHPIGVLEVDALSRLTVGAIADDDVPLAGFPTRSALVAYLAERGNLDDATPVWRVAFHHGGDGDRVELALEDQLTDEDVAAISAKLARLGDWVWPTLALIADHPRVAASQLATRVGRETAPFKVDVRKLKKLGLTQSFEVGYEISPRGRAFLAVASRPEG